MAPSPAEESVADHYGRDGLAASIEAGFAATGKATTDLTIDDLAIVDEFHTGGRPATASVLANLELGPGDAVLDVGCGVGGPARFAAATYGCAVTGIDLTPSYVEAARALTSWVGLDASVTFDEASAETMAFEAASFDAAYLFHVGMNVADKAGFFGAIARVVRPGGRLAVYDLMRTGEGDVVFPVPWASTGELSFVEGQTVYEASIEAAGFDLIEGRVRSDLAAAFVELIGGQLSGDTPGDGPGPVGLHLLLGSEVQEKLGNLVAALASETLTPVELIATRSS